MKPFRTMPTAGFLKSLLDLLFRAIILLAPVYVVLVMVGYQRPGGADVSLLAELPVLLWLPVLYQLRRLLGAMGAGRPFVRENAGRLRRLGWTVLLVVAEAFRRGAQLEDHQALTV